MAFAVRGWMAFAVTASLFHPSHHGRRSCDHEPEALGLI
jgi:hypothetical protein